MSVAPYTCILDPAAVSPGRTELNLNAGAIAIPSPSQINWGEAAIKAFLAEQLYGEAPADFRIPNRQVEIPLVLGAKQNGTEAEEELARQKIQEKVGLLQRQGGVVLRQRPNGEPLYADIVNASLVVPDVYGEAGGVEPGVILHLECLPDFYAEEIALDAVEGTGNIAAVLQKGGSQAVILGDYPARTRIVLTEKSAHSQRSLLWGFRSTHYDPAASATLFFDAYTRTVINGAITGVESETYSGNAVKLTGEVNIWHPFLELKSEAGVLPTHQGSYRLIVRASSVAGTQLRLAWAPDDASTQTLNAGATFIASSGWQLLDLGEVRLEESPVGKSSWNGVLQFATGVVANQLFVDRIWLQPLDDGAGKLRATAVPTSTLLAPVEYPGAAASSGTIHEGTAWPKPNDARAPTYLSQAFVNLAAATSSQALAVTKAGFAIPTGATIKGVEIAFSTGQVPGTAFGFMRLTGGLLKAGAEAGSSKVLVVGLGESRVWGSSTDLWGTTWTPAQINATNFGTYVYFTNTGAAAHEGEYSIQWIKVYYSIGATAITQDAVLYSGRITEVRAEGCYREDPTTTAYARVSEETGDLPRIPPSGLEARAVELFVKNSRGLLANPALNEPGEQDPGIDKIQAQVIYRPCYLGRT